MFWFSDSGSTVSEVVSSSSRITGSDVLVSFAPVFKREATKLSAEVSHSSSSSSSSSSKKVSASSLSTFSDSSVSYAISVSISLLISASVSTSVSIAASSCSDSSADSVSSLEGFASTCWIWSRSALSKTFVFSASFLSSWRSCTFCAIFFCSTSSSFSNFCASAISFWMELSASSISETKSSSTGSRETVSVSFVSSFGKDSLSCVFLSSSFTVSCFGSFWIRLCVSFACCNKRAKAISVVFVASKDSFSDFASSGSEASSSGFVSSGSEAFSSDFTSSVSETASSDFASSGSETSSVSETASSDFASSCSKAASSGFAPSGSVASSSDFTSPSACSGFKFKSCFTSSCFLSSSASFCSWRAFASSALRISSFSLLTLSSDSDPFAKCFLTANW